MPMEPIPVWRLLGDEEQCPRAGGSICAPYTEITFKSREATAMLCGWKEFTDPDANPPVEPSTPPKTYKRLTYSITASSSSTYDDTVGYCTPFHSTCDVPLETWTQAREIEPTPVCFPVESWPSPTNYGTLVADDFGDQKGTYTETGDYPNDNGNPQGCPDDYENHPPRGLSSNCGSCSGGSSSFETSVSNTLRIEALTLSKTASGNGWESSCDSYQQWRWELSEEDTIADAFNRAVWQDGDPYYATAYTLETVREAIYTQAVRWVKYRVYMEGLTKGLQYRLTVTFLVQAIDEDGNLLLPGDDGYVAPSEVEDVHTFTATCDPVHVIGESEPEGKTFEQWSGILMPSTAGFKTSYQAHIVEAVEA